MSNLKEYKFSDLYTMSSGISSKPEQAGHGFPFVSFSTVFNNFFLPETLPDLMNTSAKEQEKYSIKKGDILLTRTSETIDELGMSCVALRDYPTATYSGFVKRLRPTQNDITYDKYMAFYLRSKFFRKTMTNNAFITLRASLNEAIFSYINLYLPDYQTQKKIGDFLHLLNVKIELNARINTELESMAKTLYDYWFVQFAPHKSAGGKMVWNEELKREIPLGWEVKKLADWIESDKSGDWGKDEPEGNYIKKVSCIRGTDINGLNGTDTCNPPTRFILEKNSHKILNSHDLIIEISGGAPKQSTGRLGFITDAALKRFENPLICSNFCKAISLKDKKYLYNFVYHWNMLYDNDVFFGYEGKTSGIKNLLFDSFVNSHWTVVPPRELVDEFYDFMQKIQSQKHTLLLESQTLTELRDWLLPMLMNGQVTIQT